MAKAELDWVVPSIERVVKGRLVRAQIHEELSSPLVLQQQSLPDGHLEISDKQMFSVFRQYFHSPQVYNVAMVTQTESGFGASGLSEE